MLNEYNKEKNQVTREEPSKWWRANNADYLGIKGTSQIFSGTGLLYNENLANRWERKSRHLNC